MYPPRIGRVVGRLTVVERDSSSERRDGDHMYRCQCSCGNVVSVRWSAIRKNAKKSCGCLVAEREARFSKMAADGVSQRKHPLGETYRGMLKRCYSETHDAFPYYGGRGISVCDRWRYSFQAFVSDMGPKPSERHSMDRIDPDGNYEPGNCRWANRVEQAENTRTPRVVRLATLNGVTTTVAEWGKRLGLSDNSVAKVLKAIAVGDTPEHALVTAVYRKKVWVAGGHDYSGCAEKASRWLAKHQGTI